MIKHGNDNYYKLGLHIHTDRSDGKRSPEQVIELYRQNGYDAIALTDHWKCSENGWAGDMLLLAGAEYNKKAHDAIEGVFHILGFGMQEDPQLERDTPAQPAIDAIREKGGIAVLAHPAWSMNTLEQAKSLRGIEATEIYNAVSESHQSVRAYSPHFVENCANAGLYYRVLATDDAHYYEGDDACMGWVMAKMEDLSRENVLKAIRAGDFYATQGPELYVKREGDRVTVECSPCSYIAVMTNLTWSADRVARGENLTCHSYTLRQEDRWFRVEIRDKDGRYAWSNVFRV